MSAGPPVLRGGGMLVGFVLAMVLLPACGFYVVGWLLWSALYADWITVVGWMGE